MGGDVLQGIPVFCPEMVEGRGEFFPVLAGAVLVVFPVITGFVPNHFFEVRDGP